MEAGGQPPVPGGFPPVPPTPWEAGEEVRRAEAAAERPRPDHAATPEETPSPEPGPESPRPGQSPLDAQHESGDPFAEHPELFVGAAFAGGFVIAQILRRFGR
jgi:hypothetical protein